MTPLSKLFIAIGELLQDLEEKTKMAQTLNDVIDLIKTDGDNLVPAITALVADDQVQKQRGDALQAALDAANANPNLIDSAHADTLRNLVEVLKPALAVLTQPVTPADPPATTDPNATPTPTPGADPSVVA